MSFQGNTIITVTTPATITRGEFVSGAGTLSATLLPVGVCYDIDGTDCMVAINGTVLVELGANLSAGAGVKSDANGHAIAATDGTNQIIAILLAGGVSGDLVRAKLI